MLQLSKTDVVYIGFFGLSIVLVLILFLLGVTKAVIGFFCCPTIGMVGLDILLDLPRMMYRYYEPELFMCEVEYDWDGWPIDPETGERARNISRTLEFFMNVVFFFVYPLKVVFLLVMDVCCPLNEEEEFDLASDNCQRDDLSPWAYQYFKEMPSETDAVTDTN